MRFHSNSSLAVGALLLAAAWMIAPAASGAPGKSAQPGQANIKPNAGTSAVEYKDPEDMTTRYRPGNNKTTKNGIAVDHAGGNGVQRMDSGPAASGRAGESGISAGADATAHATARTKKHLAGVKYQDRISGGGNPMQAPRTAGRGSRH